MGEVGTEYSASYIGRKTVNGDIHQSCPSINLYADNIDEIAEHLIKDAKKDGEELVAIIVSNMDSDETRTYDENAINDIKKKMA